MLTALIVAPSGQFLYNLPTSSDMDGRQILTCIMGDLAGYGTEQHELPLVGYLIVYCLLSFSLSLPLSLPFLFPSHLVQIQRVSINDLISLSRQQFVLVIPPVASQPLSGDRLCPS